MKVVIFCGGRGTRLWPISRKSLPKPFVPIIKGKSFLQITYKRYRKIVSATDIFISTEDIYLPLVKKQLPALAKKNIILEPERRDNFGAIALSMAVINKYHPGEAVFMSWTKHLFSKEAVFLDAILAAAKYATESGMIVAIDSKPEFPSIHWGWIKTGKELAKIGGFSIREQEHHVEKPKMELVKEFYKTGWAVHTGYKVLMPSTLLGLIKKYQPNMYDGLERIIKAWGTKYQETVLNQEYHSFPKTSIDYGLYEKISEDSNVRASIKADMGWEDAFISWETFYKALITPKNKMVIEGGVDTHFMDSKDNLVIGPKGKMVAVIGLSNIAVIDTEDGLLVCKLDQTQKVKKLYKHLEHYYKGYIE